MGAECSLPTDAATENQTQTLNFDEVDSSRHLVTLMHRLNDANSEKTQFRDACDGSSFGSPAEQELPGAEEPEADELYEVEKFDPTISVYTGVVVVEFWDNKGAQLKASFLAKKVGFSIGISQSAFCGRSSAGPRVVVKSVDRDGQAWKLGVRRGLEIRIIDGTVVTGHHQAEKTLASALKQLPESC